MQGFIRRVDPQRRRVLAAVTVAGLFAGVIAAWATSAVAGFQQIASDEFTPAEVRKELDRQLGPGVPEVTAPPVTEDRIDPVIVNILRAAQEWEESPVRSPLLPDAMFTSVLLIGADASGALADVIILVLLPEDGLVPIMASLPRDLWLPSPCTGRYQRINANLGGCKGVASGPELLAIAVEDFTGVHVDHYARVNFAGFQTVIDRMGGVTVCVDAPTRDIDAGLEIPAGCINADGPTALAWVRSRNAEKLVGEDEWVPVPSSDFTRQRHQQDVLLQLGRKLASYGSIASLGTALSNLSSAVRLDDGWSLIDIASLGFQYRSLDKDDVILLKLPTSDYITGHGAWVQVPDEKFNDILAEVYPPADR